MDELDKDGWSAVSQTILDQTNINQAGHVQLDKSPDSFRQEQDVFGNIQRPEWRVMHRIKQALDPESLFASPRLPKIE
jgi:hypothetical protein